MDLSIIIVSYRGWMSLKECLDGLAAFIPGIPLAEVIIVDNNSDDGVIGVFKSDYPGFIFIQNKVNGGFANGCNIGGAYAKGEYLLFLNPDTIATELAVTTLLERARKNPEYFIISCRQEDERGKESEAYGLFPAFGTLTGPGRGIYKAINRKRIAYKLHGKDGLMTPDWVSGSVMMINSEVFRKIGGFDEDFWMYFEDMDLCRRARDMKGAIVYFTDITIQHNHGGSSRINLKTASLTKTEVLISYHIYLSKHFRGIERILLHSLLLFYNLLTGLVEAFAGLLFFASPKMFSKSIIFVKLVSYYLTSVIRGSWASPRSVKFPNSKSI